MAAHVHLGVVRRVRRVQVLPQDTDYFAVPPRPCWYIVTDGAAYRRNFSAERGLRLCTADRGGRFATRSCRRESSIMICAAGPFPRRPYDQRMLPDRRGLYRHHAVVEHRVPAADPSGQIFSPFSFVSNEPLTFSQATYSTSLNSVELNVRRKIPMPDRLTVSILFGVRYIGLPEDLDFMARPTNTGAAVTDIHVATKNDMIGPQIGTRFELYVDNRWWMNCEVKAALLDNRAQQTTTGTFTGSAGEDHTAFAGDLSLMFVYRWSPHFSTHLGYQALWIQGMAAAPNNLATNNEILRLQPRGVAQLNTFTGTVFQGPVAGLEIGW